MAWSITTGIIVGGAALLGHREQRRASDRVRREARRAEAEWEAEQERQERARKMEQVQRQRSIGRFVTRQRALGPIQLQAPTLEL